MAIGDVVAYTNNAGTEVFSVDQNGNVTFTGSMVALAVVLSAAVDATISAGGAATLTQSVHTIRGAGGNPDDCDAISGMTDAQLAILVTGAEAITYRDAAVGAGNIATNGDTSIVTATGDVVLAIRSGSVIRVTPLAITAGLPVGGLALARGSVIAGDSSAQGSAVSIVAADTVAIGDGTDVTTMALPTTGFVAKTALNTAAGRTLTGTANQVVISNGDGVAGNPTFSTPQNIGTGNRPTFAGMILSDVLMQEYPYSYINTDYATAVGVTGGLVVNYLPTATVDATTGAGVVVAGVNGVSDPTITTDGAATFVITDIVAITNSANGGENDGLYEVQSHAANLLTLKSTDSGISNRVEDWTRDQLVANAGDTGMSITKVNVSVLRSGADGLWEAGIGNQTGIVYSDVLLTSGLGVSVQAYDASLLSLAALATAADKMVYTTALDTYAEADITAAGRALLDDATAAAQRTTLGLIHTVPMAVLGAWAIDGDGVYTNGAGLVGAAPTLTVQAAGYAKAFDNGTAAYIALSGTSASGEYTSDFQYFPDVPTNDDAVYFGAALPFCEFGINTVVAQASTGAVFTPEYWNGAAWATLTVAYDGTSAAAVDGTRSFEQDGAMGFVPPADWASTTVDGQAAYWLRWRVTTVANIGIALGTCADEHAIVTPEDGFYVQLAGTITGLRLVDNVATPHTTADVKFILINHTTGLHSGELTFAMDRRAQRFAGLTLAVAAGDRLGVLVTQEDTAAEPTGVMFELEVTL